LAKDGVSVTGKMYYFITISLATSTILNPKTIWPTKHNRTAAAKRYNISRFLSGLENRAGLLTEFDEGLWSEAVEVMTVYSENDVAI
jgi:hypothetical protein